MNDFLSENLIPSYYGDKELSEIIMEILVHKDLFLKDPDLYESNEEKNNFASLAGDFEEYFVSNNNGSYKEDFLASGNNSLVSTLLQMMRKKLNLIERNMIVAEDIQRNLIPKKVPDVKNFDIAAYYHPSKHVGGDYYDFYQVNDDRLYFVVADVAGHGIPSSMIVSSMQAFVYSQIHEQKSLHALAHNLNQYLVKTMIPGKFVTLFIGSLSLVTGALNYINAGHNPPYIIRADKSVEELLPGGPIVGMLAEAAYTSGYTELKKGDILGIYTDGIVETMNDEEEEYGEDRFIEVIKNLSDRPLLGIMLKLFNDLRKFSNNSPYMDDITLLFLRKK